MKLIYAFLALLLVTVYEPIQAQKVDLDRFYFDAGYLILPREFTPAENRTFGVRLLCSPSVVSAYPEASIYEKIGLSGFQRVENDPAVGIVIEFGNVRFEKSETKVRTEEKKDKDGKVTSKTDYYSITVRYSFSGNYKILGSRTDEKSLSRKEKAKAQDLQNNRFLQAASQADPAKSVTTSGYFPYELSYTTIEYKSLTDARRYIEQNQQTIRTDLITKYVNDALIRVNEDTNRWYGYVPTQTREFLWILDSKSHPEYPIQQEAIKAVKELSKRMTATQPIDQLARDLQPVLDYFQELKTKYTGSDKRDQKMRYSAFYNLMVLNYLLDRPDQASEEAVGLIKNGYDTKDGEKYIGWSEELKKLLAKHQMASRHVQ
ncbi:hypothetical protein LX87_05042 [Larkinella arboricola]|uniref:Uncharacterized protein n=1 Tax=Larkinella arboricola TaxID=643671 RepID=A0A327WMM8_LARAB|nr:hypothetical protein [Larkinella arboricola]RAJ92078.1 hypothetical protein LX87_05042 [Larkinella arboricola]